jgi:hypothetical protein
MKRSKQINVPLAVTTTPMGAVSRFNRVEGRVDVNGKVQLSLYNDDMNTEFTVPSGSLEFGNTEELKEFINALGKLSDVL